MYTALSFPTGIYSNRFTLYFFEECKVFSLNTELFRAYKNMDTILYKIAYWIDLLQWPSRWGITK